MGWVDGWIDELDAWIDRWVDRGGGTRRQGGLSRKL